MLIAIKPPRRDRRPRPIPVPEVIERDFADWEKAVIDYRRMDPPRPAPKAAKPK